MREEESSMKQPQPLPAPSVRPSVQPSISEPSGPGAPPPSGPRDGLHLQPGNFGPTIQDSANSRRAVPVKMLGALPSIHGAGSQTPDNERDNWSSESYQRVASFVPRMTEKVLQLLDVQPDDVILDIGCGGVSSMPSFLVSASWT